MKITSSLPDDIPRMVIRYKLKYGKLLVFIFTVRAGIIDTRDPYLSCYHYSSSYVYIFSIVCPSVIGK